MTIVLRPVRPGDLPVFFVHQCDGEAAAMAGFTPRARDAFDAHWGRIVAGPPFVVRTIEAEGAVAGYVSAFPHEGRVEIAYWLGRDYWHRGIGQAAVAAFLAEYRERPLFASVIDTNAASQAILERCGFTVVGEEIGDDGVCERTLRLGWAPPGPRRTRPLIRNRHATAPSLIVTPAQAGVHMRWPCESDRGVGGNGFPPARE